MDKQGRVLVAFDHAPLGLLDGLQRMPEVIPALVPAKPAGIILNFGPMKRFGELLIAAGIAPIMRLDGNRTFLAGDWTASPEWDLFYSAETAAAMGAQGVIVNLLVGGPAELASLTSATRAAAAAHRLGIPLYVSSIVIDPATGRQTENPDHKAFGARMAFELGADVVNVYGAEDPAVIEHVKPWCAADVVAQGAPATAHLDAIANWAEKCVASGADGVCVGRAIWGAPRPAAVLHAIEAALGARGDRGEQGAHS
jgi:fructose-bisphosphate aldolase / 2-amino-3,7-dideoxy-D-threo-hept-6-ulosonate synthase